MERKKSEELAKKVYVSETEGIWLSLLQVAHGGQI